MAAPLRVAVLLSGTGSLLQALIDAAADPGLGATIVVVGSDRTRAQGLSRAERVGIPTFAHPCPNGSDRAAWDVELTRLVAEHEPDLVVSAGFMKLVGVAFLAAFAGRIINTHPALLPSFPGMHGVRDALAYGVKVTGATVFVVDDGVDSGRILDQDSLRIEPADTEDSLHERIKQLERTMLVGCVADFAAGRLSLPYPCAQQRDAAQF